MSGIIAESFALQSAGRNDLLRTKRDGERQSQERAAWFKPKYERLCGTAVPEK